MDIVPNEQRHNYELNDNAKVCKLVTGFWPDDPRILDKFDEDQQVVIKKYGLPSMGLFRNDPAEYERQIRKSAKENGIRIVATSESGDYFKEFPKVEAVNLHHLNRERIVVDIDRSNFDKYKEGLNSLVHEYVHTRQAVKYPDLPPELVEYEAYLVNFSVEKMRKLPRPEDAAFVIFSGFYMGSLRHLYQGSGQTPSWENPAVT